MLRHGDFQLVEEREFKSHHVMRMLATHDRILEKPVRWPGSIIPIVMVPGRVVIIDGKVHYLGLCRYAQDPVRMVNYWASAAAERVGSAPHNPYVVTEDQIDGHEDEWEDAPRSRRVFLVVNDVEGMPLPKREPAPDMPSAELQMVLVGQEMVQKTLGMHQSNLGHESNEVSGKAILARQRPGSIGTSIYSDNLAKAIERVGEICCEVIPKVYSSERAQRLVLDDGSQAWVELGRVQRDQQTGKDFLIAPLDLTRYSVSVSVTKSYETMSEELVERTTEWGKNDPQTFRQVQDILFDYMDIPGAKRIAKRLKANVPRHLLSEEEQAEIPEPIPTPEQQVQMKEFEARTAEAQAKMMEAQAKMAEAQSKPQQSDADVEIANLKVVQEELKTLREQIKAAQEGEGEQVKNLVNQQVNSAMREWKKGQPA